MKRFAIIGVGNFGNFLCQAFSRTGHEVLAVDCNETALEQVKEIVTTAVIADATDRTALRELEIETFDTVLVNLGDRIEASVLTTLYLKELGAGNIIVKAVSEDHGTVLERVGADEVVYPDRDMAERVAFRMADQDVIEFFPLGGDYSLLEWAPRREMIGKTLAELHLRSTFNVTVILVQQVVPDEVVVAPGGDFLVKDSDILVLLGRNEDLEVLRHR